MAKRTKKKKGFSDYLRLLILVVCLGVFLYSGYQLLSTYLEYREIDSKHDSLRDEIMLEKPDTGYKSINWEELLSINADIVAWIEIPDTKIDYPIMDKDDNDAYLFTDINGEYSKEGSLFVDANNDVPFVDLNTIIYGHNMLNNSMFGDLPEFTDRDFVAQHPYVNIYLPDGTVTRYKIVSVHTVDARGPVYEFPVTDLNAYYPVIEENNILENNFDRNGAPMITLSTCVSGDEADMSRIVLHATVEKAGIDPKTEKMQ